MANPGLAHLLDETIGQRLGDATWNRSRGIERFADDAEFQRRFVAIKRANKERLARWCIGSPRVDIDPASIFDVQAKRIHEYKRQLLMALGIVHEYLALVEDGVEPPVPRDLPVCGQSGARLLGRAR